MDNCGSLESEDETKSGGADNRLKSNVSVI